MVGLELLKQSKRLTSRYLLQIILDLNTFACQSMGQVGSVLERCGQLFVLSELPLLAEQLVRLLHSFKSIGIKLL